MYCTSLGAIFARASRSTVSYVESYQDCEAALRKNYSGLAVQPWRRTGFDPSWITFLRTVTFRKFTRVKNYVDHLPQNMMSLSNCHPNLDMR